jgi:hypothetical protein
MLEGEQHARRTLVVGTVNDDRAGRWHGCQVICHLSSSSAVNGLAFVISHWKVMVQGDESNFPEMVTQPNVHVLRILEEDDFGAGQRLGQARPHGSDAIRILFEDYHERGHRRHFIAGPADPQSVADFS